MKLKQIYSIICVVSFLTAASATSAFAQETIIDDSFADGDQANTEADPHDTDWWTSISSGGLEVSKGKLGLVSGPSGRGIHTIFPAQKLEKVGDELVVKYSFTTPTTIGENKGAALRVGLFDSLGQETLKANLTASSSKPNLEYKKIPGYMLDMDVGTGSADLNLRKHVLDQATGRFMSTTKGFEAFDETGDDDAYSFKPGVSYDGSIKVKRISDTSIEITGSIGKESHSVTEKADSASFDMLGFHAIGGAFGSSEEADKADNGVDFTNVKVTFNPAPIAEAKAEATDATEGK